MSIRLAGCQPGLFAVALQSRAALSVPRLLSNEGRLVGKAAREGQGALLVVPSRAFSKAVAKSWRGWSGLERAQSFSGGQTVVAFLVKRLVIPDDCRRQW